METKNLKQRITSGLVWTYLERICSQGVSTLVTIILARLLLPEDYGVVSIVTIFITICDALVVGGFSDTLIQKKDADEVDFSTLFWFVLALGFIMYGIVFAIAPFVESFFDTTMVAVTLRVMAIRLPINAIKSIQSAYISKKMMYRYFFLATLWGTIVSAIVGIAMAYLQFGVWALVAQYLINSIIGTIVIWFTCGWKPDFKFDLTRLKNLYSFGWKMQLSSILSTFYSELESVCIGKKYTSVDLAYYDKGRQFPKLIMHNVQSTISKVMLPAFSHVNDDTERMKALARKSIKTSTYVMFPLLIGLMACAPEFVSAILTDKWLPSVPFLRLLSIYYLCEPLMSLNKQVVIASGEAKKYLTMEITKKSIGIVLLLLALIYFDSVISIAAVTVINQIIGLFIQSAPLKKLIDYPIQQQMRDAFPALMQSLLMLIPIGFIKLINANSWILLAAEVVAGIFIYVVVSVIAKNESFYALKEMVFKLMKRK